MNIKGCVVLLALAAAVASPAVNLPGLPPELPKPAEGDFIIRDFHFKTGQTLPELRMHYRTFGAPASDNKGVVRNAVLILHGTTGSGEQFLSPQFADELFAPGQPLDLTKYFIILSDGIGHGKSSKPSDGLRASFPNYGYRDMVEAQYRLVTEGLKVNHLRLVMGTSMGGMHTWLWGEIHPEFMDALMPLACLPVAISGRNRVWRRMIIDSIRGAPDWQNGNYTSQPYGLRIAAEVLYFMGANPALRQKEAPSLHKADVALDISTTRLRTSSDANDILYALEASQDYEPAGELQNITAPLLAINSADDLINPPDLGILEMQIKLVPKGRAILIPESEETAGHGTHTKAALWKNDLLKFLKDCPPR
ncbi:MAG TPA: alpha/beta fold hydrolase [Verrucomicrobiae bacterium]|jgi:homoserine O-acetyltransferase